MANPSDLKRNLGCLRYFITRRHSKEQKKGGSVQLPPLIQFISEQTSNYCNTGSVAGFGTAPVTLK